MRNRAQSSFVVQASIALAFVGFACSPATPTGGGDGEDGVLGEADGAPAVGAPDAGNAGDVCDNGIDDDGNGLIDDGCSCAPGATQSCFPDEAAEACAGVQSCVGTAEFGVWGPCEDVPDCDRPTAACDTLARETHTQVLEFANPLTTLGQCPWDIGDNLGFVAGAMAARHEVTQSLEAPARAVLCSVSFRVPETDMYYDDFMFVLFNDVVVLSPSDWSSMLDEEDGLLVYDWSRVRGNNGGSPPAYCPGAGSTCDLPNTQENGSISLDLDEDTQLRLFDRAAGLDRYDITVAATGDNDPSKDCAHSDFNLEVTYEYVVPGP